MTFNASRRSFKRTAWLFYGLASLFPYLIGIYLILELKIALSYTLINVLALTLVLILTGALVIEAFSRRLRHLATRVAESVQGEEAEKIDLDDMDVEEVFMLSSNFNEILEKLDHYENRSKELTAKMLSYVNKLDHYERKMRDELLIRTNLSRYVGSDMVEEMMRSNMTEFENVECTATILFADIRGFTALSETLEPQQVVQLLNRHFEVMVPEIFEFGGTLDKFVGDELMAIFRDHPYGERAPLRAIRASLKMIESINALNHGVEGGSSNIHVGIGINVGKVVIGNVGSKNRKDYTAIGDTVNVAARFEKMAGGDEIIVGHGIHDICKDQVEMEEFGTTVLKNRSHPVQAYKVLKVNQ